MPPPTLPPTPSASTELIAKDQTMLPQPEKHIDLPPSAFAQSIESQVQPFSDQAAGSHKSSAAHPSPSEPFHTPKSPARKRTASQANLPTNSFSLPPPPSRSRKIIQVKPKQQEQKAAEKQAQEEGSSAAAKGSATGKKKQGGGSTAGRKIARKTAHSLIERRRRSKMNEEFGVLKDMIPACAGQEMHKLAILQASIDYMRYLENCLTEVRHGKQLASSAPSSAIPTRPQSAITQRSDSQAISQDDDLNDDDDVREEEEHTPSWRNASRDRIESISGSTLISPAISAMAASPAFAGQTYGHTWHRTSAGQFELPSPASVRYAHDRTYGPHNVATTVPSPTGHSTQTSPALVPQSSHSSAPSELDQEASAALLMLNASDRRSGISGRKEEPQPRKQSSGYRGISVKDLLSN